MDVHFTLHGIPFVWDSAKARANLGKHGVSFETACEAFFDPFLRLTGAGDHDEDRLAFLGTTDRGRLLFVVYVERRHDVFRIISARPATPGERREYEDL
ncbi:MAG: BrnT family toxin [Deferrisomatales bacterium]|nr:BrnT family toxin [Deferrisomatales bacterium]